jgi:hypothetical protein
MVSTPKQPEDDRLPNIEEIIDPLEIKDRFPGLNFSFGSHEAAKLLRFHRPLVLDPIMCFR